MVNKLIVKSSGRPVYNVDNVDKAIFIKNPLNFSDDFPRSIAKGQFCYLDNDDSTVANTGTPPANHGITASHLLANAGKTVQTIMPLNKYSFFEGLSDQLLPPMLLEFEIKLQNNAELIGQNEGTDRRVIVRAFELWVSQWA